jgi:hypothetical protein
LWHKCNICKEIEFSSYRLWSIYNSYPILLGVIMEFIVSEAEDRSFVEFRRKVRFSELLSAAIGETLIVDSLYGPGKHRGAEMAAC